jgi:perosamine synthetase
MFERDDRDEINPLDTVILTDAPNPRVPFARTLISQDAIDAVTRVLQSGWVTTGPEVQVFEQEFAASVEATHAVAVASCTAAIELALRALNLPPGAKVLTSTLTFCGAVNAILHAGLRPVLVDVNPDTLMPDADTTKRAKQGAGGAEAMVVVHFAGHPAPIEELADAAGLTLDRVVEDAAHGLGTWVGTRRVGSISAATCFSFYATKNLPIGEGGMVTTNDPQVADYVRRCRLHGMSRDAWKRYLPGAPWRYDVLEPGLKANMTDVQAAIGRAHLRLFDGWQAARAELVGRYDSGLWGVGGIALPSRPVEGRHAWHLYVIRVLSSFGMGRDAFVSALADHGIDCSVHFIPVHHMAYAGRGRPTERPLPVADAVFEQIVSLPLYQSLTLEEVDRVCHAVHEIATEIRSSIRASQQTDIDPQAVVNSASSSANVVTLTP